MARGDEPAVAEQLEPARQKRHEIFWKDLRKYLIKHHVQLLATDMHIWLEQFLVRMRKMMRVVVGALDGVVKTMAVKKNFF